VGVGPGPELRHLLVAGAAALAGRLAQQPLLGGGVRLVAGGAAPAGGWAVPVSFRAMVAWQPRQSVRSGAASSAFSAEACGTWQRVQGPPATGWWTTAFPADLSSWQS
jgi:hypothetical protein